VVILIGESHGLLKIAYESYVMARFRSRGRVFPS
jgi:hypothetical protein